MEENVNATQIADTEIDTAWDGDLEVDTEPVTPPVTAPVADQPGTEQQTQEPATPAQPSEAPATPELFTIKNRDETRQVSREELVAMAQKGWDYDTVRQERDQLRQYRNEADPALELLKSYAKRSGMELGAYLDYCRQQELMAGGMSEQDAAAKVGMERERADLDAREAVITAAERQRDQEAQRAQEQAQARQRDFESFIAAYPNVDPKSIPNEVWMAVQKGETLMMAYMKHENARLQAELAAERQNKSNQQRTPGSLGGNAVTEMDEIDRLWAEDD